MGFEPTIACLASKSPYLRSLIKVYREVISYAEIEVRHLQKLIEQQAINKTTREDIRRVLKAMRDMNLEYATFAEKQDIIAKLGIKVYPLEDGKVVRVASKLQPFVPTPTLSPQIISIASPKL